MGILDSAKKIKTAVKDAYKVKKEEDKAKVKGSQLIEVSDAQVEKFAELKAAGETDLEKIRIHADMRDAEGKKLSWNQIKEVALIVDNWITYDNDPDNYTISEDGKVLTFTGEIVE